MKQITSRVVYENAWMSVREDQVELPDGTPGSYGVVDKPDFALVIPRDAAGFWMVEQFRYPVGRRAWEFPQGSWGPGGQGSPAELASAELREETGLSAATMTPGPAVHRLRVLQPGLRRLPGRGADAGAAAAGAVRAGHDAPPRQPGPVPRAGGQRRHRGLGHAGRRQPAGPGALTG
jgi:hypothetical protein